MWLNWIWRIPRLTLVGLITIYQWTLSPLLGPRCKYHPSCSHYAVGALTTHGALKGTVLGAWRIVRCNPWSLGGLDPVPDKGRWLPDILPNGEVRPQTTQERARVHP